MEEKQFYRVSLGMSASRRIRVVPTISDMVDAGAAALHEAERPAGHHQLTLLDRSIAQEAIGKPAAVRSATRTSA
ncbi:hypothetical protein Q0Z83_038240 [Actinoplanes sichuanensis]|uniref:Uncharacterized protein n=1 Tax=Actinoplanes sichuanensis TaxID=512349 RepID=A0ABW4A4B4_9ACTN|nr:hypothetical protein [Actinoplanes sichuanensis]BEL05633.1 hypothetical protein Q0Z83_038240 [Actinoplanes sichuanensis]